MPGRNKRAAAILLEAFLGLNGRMLETSDDELEAMIRLAAESNPADRDGTVERLTSWLGAALAPLSEDDSV